MKYFFLLLSAALLFSPYTTIAQGFFLNFKTGYSFQAATDDLGSPLEELGDGNLLIDENGHISDKSLFGTLGAGYSANLGFGYEIDKNFMVELVIVYSKGKKFLDARINTPTYFAEQRSQAGGIVLTPNITIQGNTKLKPFVKFGLVVPVGGSIKTEANLIDDEARVLCRFFNCSGGVSPFQDADLHIELDGKAKTTAHATVGFMSAVGLRYPLSEHISIFGEINVGMTTFKAKKTEYIEYKDIAVGFLTPGVSIDLSRDLEDLTTYERVINYVDEITETSNNSEVNPNYNPNLPMDIRSLKSNASNISLLFGVQYNF